MKTQNIILILSGKFRRFLLFAIIFISTLIPSCKENDGLNGINTVLTALQKEARTFTILSVNLQNVYEKYPNEQNPIYIISWQNRYQRIADWMHTSSNRPDLIALQEVFGQSGNLEPYETLFTLITKIREKTNIEYRIAYLTVSPVRQGIFSPPLWAGNALLYNPAKVTNKTISAAGENVRDYNDESTLNVHLRKSLPCPNGVSRLIDGDGLAWISPYKFQEDITWDRWYAGPSFTRLELVNAPGEYIHIYNLHVKHHEGQSGFYVERVKTLLEQMESKFGSTRLYPPIILGDFNLGFQPINPDVIEGSFTNFVVAAAAEPTDVVGVIIGNQSDFPSKQRAKFEQLIPVAGPKNDPAGYCGNEQTFWSDHCPVYVQIEPE